MVMSVVEGHPTEIQLTVGTVRLLGHHAVNSLVVAVQQGGVVEELVTERAPDGMMINHVTLDYHVTNLNTFSTSEIVVFRDLSNLLSTSWP